MIDTHGTPRALGSGPSAATSGGFWAVVLGAAVVLLSLRLPRFIEVAESAVAQQAEALGDPDLAGAAVAVGTIVALGIHVLLLGLGALLAALLERALGPHAIGGRLRVGVGGLTFAVIVLGLQAAAVILAVAAVDRSWPVWLAAAAVALLAPAAFPAARTSASAYAKSLVASGATAVLLCAG